MSLIYFNRTEIKALTVLKAQVSVLVEYLKARAKFQTFQAVVPIEFIKKPRRLA